jgi:flagellin FlaB
MKQDNAFTGLEAAIVLIAFVVVAAIFSYVLLGAGFFATQKAQEVAYAGIKQSTSNAVIDGSVYLYAPTKGELQGFMINIRIPLGGDAVDMSKTQFLYSSSEDNPQALDNQVNPSSSNLDNDITYPGSSVIMGFYPTGLDSTTGKVCDPDTDGKFTSPCVPNPILSSGEVATFLVTIPTALSAKEWFSIEMKPSVGAATFFTKPLGSGFQNGDLI